MAVLPPLYPNAGPTVINSGTWQDENGSAISVGDGSHTNINMAPTAPGADVEFIKVDSGGIEYSLTDMPADLASLDSLTANIRLRTNGLINDTYTFSVVILDSGGTVIGSVTTIAATTTITNFTTFNVAIATLTDPTNKTRWDGAVIRLNAIRNANMGADGGSTGQISAVELTGTYTSSGPTVYTDSGTAYLKLTPSGDEAKSPQLVPPLVADFQEGLAKNGELVPDTAGDPDFSIRWGSPTYVVNGGEVYAAFDPGENFEWRNIFFDPFSGEVIRTSVIVKHPWSDVEPGEGAGSHQEFLNFFALGEEYELLTGFVYSLDDNKWHVECISAGDFNKFFVTPVPGNQFIRVDVAFDPTFGSIQMQLYLDPNGPATETLDVPGNYPEFFLSPDWMTFGRTGGDEPGTITFDSINVRYTDYRADADTVYLKLTASGADEYTENTGPFEYLDANTARVSLTPSVVESKETADASTARVTLTPSVVEIRERTDSATAYVDLTASATEAREIADASTARLTLTPSGVEQRELVDATTVSLKLTPSGTEFVERVTEDSATAYLDLTPSGTEQHSRQLTDADTAYLKLTPSGAEEHGRLTSDAATGYLDLTPSAVELEEAVDANTAYVKLTPNATEFYAPPKTTGVDSVEFEEPLQNPDTGLTTVYMRARANSGTGIIRLIAYQDGVELDREDFTLTLSLQEFSFSIAGITDYEPLTVSFEGLNLDGGELEAYIADIWLAVPGGVVTHYEDSNTAYLKLTPSADEAYEPAEGVEYLDANTAYLTLTPSVVEAREVTDAETARLTLTASGVENREITDAATATVVLTPSATEEYTGATAYTDANTAYVDLTPSGVEARESTDAATARVTLTPSAVELRERVDSATAYVDITASGIESREVTDAATASLKLTASAIEDHLVPGGYTDANTALLILTASAVEIRERTDAATATLVLTPSSVAFATYLDSNTATVVLTASGIESKQATGEDAATVTLTLTPSADVSYHTLDAATVTLVLTPSATEEQEAGGTQYVDANTATLRLTASGSDAAQYDETNTASIYLTASAVEASDYSEDAVATVRLTPSGVAFTERTTTETVTLVLTPSGTTTRHTLDENTAYLDLTPSATTSVDYLDASTAYLTLTVSAAVLITYLLTARAYLRWDAYAVGRRYSGRAYTMDNATAQERFSGRAYPALELTDGN